MIIVTTPHWELERGEGNNYDIFGLNQSSAFIDLFNIVKLGLIDIILFSSFPPSKNIQINVFGIFNGS